MTTSTVEIYRTESGSVYEVMGDQVRRCSADATGPANEWSDYAAINRLPASVFRPGVSGEVLEIILRGGRRIYTSRLIVPVDSD